MIDGEDEDGLHNESVPSSLPPRSLQHYRMAETTWEFFA